MIQRGTVEWHKLLNNFEKSKGKTNKDILCLVCWQVYKHNARQRHAAIAKDHKELSLTPKFFASEELFTKLAYAHGKCCRENGEEFFEDPFFMKRRDLYDLRGAWKRPKRVQKKSFSSEEIMSDLTNDGRAERETIICVKDPSPTNEVADKLILTSHDLAPETLKTTSAQSSPHLYIQQENGSASFDSINNVQDKAAKAVQSPVMTVQPKALYPKSYLNVVSARPLVSAQPLAQQYRIVYIPVLVKTDVFLSQDSAQPMFLG